MAIIQRLFIVVAALFVVANGLVILDPPELAGQVSLRILLRVIIAIVID